MKGSGEADSGAPLPEAAAVDGGATATSDDDFYTSVKETPVGGGGGGKEGTGDPDSADVGAGYDVLEARLGEMLQRTRELSSSSSSEEGDTEEPR